MSNFLKSNQSKLSKEKSVYMILQYKNILDHQDVYFEIYCYAALLSQDGSHVS